MADIYTLYCKECGTMLAHSLQPFPAEIDPLCWLCAHNLLEIAQAFNSTSMPRIEQLHSQSVNKQCAVTLRQQFKAALRISKKV